MPNIMPMKMYQYVKQIALWPNPLSFQAFHSLVYKDRPPCLARLLEHFLLKYY
jgi:hypothetical protein